MALRRGFKSDCERIAERIRTTTRLSTGAPVTPETLSQHLGVELVAGDELLPLSRFTELRDLQPDAFSACTFPPIGGRTVVVYNPLSSKGRRNSDLAHELAHILLGHELSRIQAIGDSTFFSCDPQQEEEATWLASCLLLPRGLLLEEVRHGKTAAAIAQQYEVTEAMATFRINVTGVLRQVRQGKRTPAKKSTSPPTQRRVS